MRTANRQRTDGSHIDPSEFAIPLDEGSLLPDSVAGRQYLLLALDTGSVQEVRNVLRGAYLELSRVFHSLLSQQSLPG